VCVCVCVCVRERERERERERVLSLVKCCSFSGVLIHPKNCGALPVSIAQI
jgi:hypothetical protein